MQPSPHDVAFFGALADALSSDWRQKARPEQIAPAGDWLIWLLLAGRGFGKTRTGSEWVREMVEGGHARRLALVGPTAADVRDIIVEGEAGILSISPAWNRPIYEPSKRRLTWPHGAIATLFSSEEPDRLRGPEHDAAWCDELAAWSNLRMTWDMLAMGLRAGTHPRCVITTTPRPVPLIRELVARAAKPGADVVVTRGRTSDNAANLAPTFLRAISSRYAGTRLGRQELDGEILDDVQGALWTRDMIEKCRVSERPRMVRIVVAIDPAATSGEDADETGIVAAGLGEDGRFYVLDDASGRYSPHGWASAAVGLYHLLGADRIVAETNQGGEMVESTVRNVDENVSYKAVHAVRGKILRAEPVGALYEQGRVHHVRAFPELEDQMCTFAPGSSGSPDRLDAMVFAITELCERTGAESWLAFMEGQVRDVGQRPPAAEPRPAALPWHADPPGAPPTALDAGDPHAVYLAARDRLAIDAPTVCATCRQPLIRFHPYCGDGERRWHPTCSQPGATIQ